ncbi:MAG TPA: inner membrane-spanning protein YciB [Caulobacter sp.]|nr:inner membrane-spanning protein YciB [Caulobacter sp.]
MAELSPKARSWVRATVDYGGLVAFLVGFLVTRNLVSASWWLVAGSAAALLLGFVAERRVAPMPLIAGGAALVFGTLTLVFNDERFLKMKPTIMNVTFGVALLGGLLAGKNPLKLLMGEALTMSRRVWRVFTLRYGIFFLCLAGLNEVVWRNFPDEVWVLFRFPGLILLTLAFSLAQTPLIMKGMKEAEAEGGPHVEPEDVKPPPPLVE